MARIVQKFGGTSVADIDHIKRVAARVKKDADAGHEIAVVVSAMGFVTDELVGYVGETATIFDAREYDTVVSSGEQVTSGLLALALQDLGVDARSWQGWQIPIHTNDLHGKARITGNRHRGAGKRAFRPVRLRSCPGFRASRRKNRITTLGRGGSDTTAVALAAALQADRCDIFTDVDGVYTCDPRIVAKARKLDRITYEEMLEMGVLGRQGVADAVGRTGHEASRADAGVVLVQGRAGHAGGGRGRNRGKRCRERHYLQPGRSQDHARPFVRSARCGGGDLWTVGRGQHQCGYDRPRRLGRGRHRRFDLYRLARRFEAGARGPGIAPRGPWLSGTRPPTRTWSRFRSSGSACAATPASPSRCSRTLADRGINIQVISTSEIKISVLISEDYAELALRALHSAYGLDGDA